MAAQNRDIELLPQEEWEKTSLGKFIKWILTVGRYIVIFTELIVISAFISRFKLDRDLSHIYEDIERKQSLIVANEELEKEFRELKAQLEMIEKVNNSQKTSQNALEEMTLLMPIDVSLSNFNIEQEKITVKAVALTEEGFASFIINLKESPRFNELNLTNVYTGTDKTIGVNFSLETDYTFIEREPES